MRNSILAAVAAAVLATGSAAPASAQRLDGEISIRIGDRQNDYRDARRYYRQRCRYNEIVVRDVYSGRRFCVDRRDYRRYMRNQNRGYYRY